MDTLTGADVKKYLLGVEKSGIYSVVDIKNAAAGPAGGVIDGLQAATECFWDVLHSLYASHEYAQERGRIAIALLPHGGFQLVGLDARAARTPLDNHHDPR